MEKPIAGSSSTRCCFCCCCVCLMCILCSPAGNADKMIKEIKNAFSTLVSPTTPTVPLHSLEMDRFRNSIDLDAEQTEARYDQEMLSDIINDNDRGELQKKAESCTVDDYKYDHGQKVSERSECRKEVRTLRFSLHCSPFIFLSPGQIQRLDPCEICLCIDGEIFCWWKQCGKSCGRARMRHIMIKARAHKSAIAFVQWTIIYR